MDLMVLLVALVAMGHSDYWAAEQMEEDCTVMVHGESWVVGEQANWKMVGGHRCLQQTRVSRAVGTQVRHS